MSNARNLANLLSSTGDVRTAHLDNAPAPTKSSVEALGIAASSITGALPAISGENLTGIDGLPSQSGNSGEFLTTNGTAASWADLDTDANTTTKGLYENHSVISTGYSITANNNAMSAGPITVNSGITVTVPATSTWTIL